VVLCLQESDRQGGTGEVSQEYHREHDEYHTHDGNTGEEQ